MFLYINLWALIVEFHCYTLLYIKSNNYWVRYNWIKSLFGFHWDQQKAKLNEISIQYFHLNLIKFPYYLLFKSIEYSDTKQKNSWIQIISLIIHSLTKWVKKSAIHSIVLNFYTINSFWISHKNLWFDVRHIFSIIEFIENEINFCIFEQKESPFQTVFQIIVRLVENSINFFLI